MSAPLHAMRAAESKVCSGSPLCVPRIRTTNVQGSSDQQTLYNSASLATTSEQHGHVCFSSRIKRNRLKSGVALLLQGSPASVLSLFFRQGYGQRGLGFRVLSSSSSTKPKGRRASPYRRARMHPVGLRFTLQSQDEAWRKGPLQPNPPPLHGAASLDHPPPPPYGYPPLPVYVANIPSSPCGVVVGFGLFNPRPPSSGLWVSGLVFNPFPPPCGVVVCVGFRAWGLHPRPLCGVGGGVV